MKETMTDRLRRVEGNAGRFVDNLNEKKFQQRKVDQASAGAEKMLEVIKANPPEGITIL